MNFLDTIILGLVEGITEFLPISSTAHLEITSYLLNIQNTVFSSSFNIAIQLGAILAVLFLYRKEFFNISTNYIKNVLIAFVPTGIIGFVLYKIIKGFLLQNLLVIPFALILGGIVILFFEKKYQKIKGDESKDISNLSKKDLLLMGLAQALAVVPGVSRSLTVILSGRMLGLTKKVVTEFSFLLAIPTMFFATLYDLYKSSVSFEKGDWGLLSIGFMVSFVVALVVVKWLLKYIKNNSFEVFGWYRIILGIFLLVFFR